MSQLMKIRAALGSRVALGKWVSNHGDESVKADSVVAAMSGCYQGETPGS